MSVSKTFNSKNLSAYLDKLFLDGKDDLALQVMKSVELKSLLPNIVAQLKKKITRREDFEETKIYSRTELDKDFLLSLGERMGLRLKESKIIIDKNMGAGVKIKSGDKLVDATFESMFEQEVVKLLKK